MPRDRASQRQQSAARMMLVALMAGVLVLAFAALGHAQEASSGQFNFANGAKVQNTVIGIPTAPNSSSAVTPTAPAPTPPPARSTGTPTTTST